MGFGIPIASLCTLLEQISELDRNNFNIQCNSCEEFISEEDEYCPSCGEKLPENIFQQRGLTELAAFCEKAIENMGINPVLARIGYESWTFHKGQLRDPDVRIPAFVSVLYFSAEQPTEEKPGAGI